MVKQQVTAARFLLIAAICCGIAVIMGAFAAHGLKNILSDQALATIRTAVLYQFVHGLALLGCALALAQQLWFAVERSIRIAGYCFISGTILFSGSLYGLSVFNLTFLGPVTPLGGVAFIFGWVALIISSTQLLRQLRHSND